jgi:hypothetical protein
MLWRQQKEWSEHEPISSDDYGKLSQEQQSSARGYENVFFRFKVPVGMIGDLLVEATWRKFSARIR